MEEASNTGPFHAYEALLKNGELRPDPIQSAVMLQLQKTSDQLEKSLRKATGLFAMFTRANREDVPKSVYIFGDVGRGKSMVMDLFFETVSVPNKRRVHFHAFMLECHQRIHAWRKTEHSDNDDPIPPLAAQIASEARLLCFDEFQVSDVADAMILGRLYKELFRRGVTIVSTSNRRPDTLYEGGINRALFLPFIDMIEAEMVVLELNGPTDYRLDRIKGLPVYYTPINEQTTEQLRTAFFKMTDREVEDATLVPSETLEVMGGRSLFVPKSSKGVAVFSFKRLCADPKDPRGAADYLAIAWAYHTVILVAIPQMTREQRNEAKRFVTLIDTLYDNNVKLFCSAAVPPEDLYPAGDGSFEFARTVSRLMEMQSQEYLSKGHAI